MWNTRSKASTCSAKQADLKNRFVLPIFEKLIVIRRVGQRVIAERFREIDLSPKDIVLLNRESRCKVGYSGKYSLPLTHNRARHNPKNTSAGLNHTAVTISKVKENNPMRCT